MAVEQTRQIEQTPGTAYRFTVDEFQRMGDIGIFRESDRVELLDGEIVVMNPISPGHSGRVRRMLRILMRELGDRALLDAQNPLQLRPQGQPQPDIVVLRPRADDYASAHPTAADVLLLVEIADSSLAHDRDTKARVYAQAGIADYWIVNFVDSTLMVYRQPVNGIYRSHHVLGGEDVVQPVAFPDVSIAVAEILR